MNITGDKKLHFETLQLHAGQEKPDPATDARAVPIYATTSYVFDNCQDAEDRFALKANGNIYGRLTNPTQEIFEKRIAALEGGSAALAVSSGAAAVTYTIQALAKAGDNIVAAKTIYGGSYNLLEHTLPLYGIQTKFVDPDEENAFENAVDGNTKAIYIEALGKAAMGLNLSRVNDIYLYSSDRLAHIMADGQLAFIDRRNGFSTLFEEDEAAFYDTKEEFFDKLRYFKENPQKRMEVARKGWQKIHTEYNERVVTKFMADLLFDKYEPQGKSWQIVIND